MGEESFGRAAATAEPSRVTPWSRMRKRLGQRCRLGQWGRKYFSRISASGGTRSGAKLGAQVSGNNECCKNELKCDAVGDSARAT